METSRALAALGNRVEQFWSVDLGRRIEHGNLHYILELPRAYRREVRERLSRRDFDVVQLSQPHSFLAARMLRRRRNSPLMVWRSHGLEAKVEEAIARFGGPRRRDWKRPLRQFAAGRLRWAQREAVRWSDGAIVPCSDDKRYLVDHFGAEDHRVRVIWHGVPDEYLDAPASDDPARWRRLLHVSQLSANKGPMVMNEVATRVLGSHSGLEMTWVCPVALHESILASLPDGVRQRIRLLDWVSREELMELYDRHGLFLFPTLAEGAAKVVMEAMSRGMCVVASDTSGPSDYLRDGANGWLVPVGDSAAMAAAAERLAGNSEDCHRTGMAARDTAKQFRWSRCAGEMLDFYEDLRRLRIHEPVRGSA
jgi:glycosyltransferase involved in cell wall biosynthesis